MRAPSSSGNSCCSIGNTPAIAMPVRSVIDGGPGFEQRCVASELVEDVSREPIAGLRWHERPGAVDVCKRTAAIDVGDENGGCIGVLQHAVVHEVGEVDLGRAARSFQEHQFVLLGDAVVGRRPSRARGAVRGPAMAVR